VKIAHLADLHLGYRAYRRTNAHGRNVREADVAQAFEQAIDALIALRPDLVLLAGDIVHTVRPSNTVVAHAFRQLSRLRKGLERVPIVIIAGNHDSPRTEDTGNLLLLFQEIPGVVAVTHARQQVHIEPLDATVLCVPHNAIPGVHRLPLEPDGNASTNILMLHGTVVGAQADEKLRLVAEHGGQPIEDRMIAPERWDYIALGHYHVATALAPNMWYAGGLERTSTNIWMETGPKGFVVYDTETRIARFHAVPTRPMVDLPAIDAHGLSIAEIDRRVRDAVEGIEGGIEGKLVRQVVVNLPRHLVRQLDHARLREYRAAALHFQLDVRPPRRLLRERLPLVRAGTSPGRTLEEEVADWFCNRYRPASADVDPDRLLGLAREYLEAPASDLEA